MKNRTTWVLYFEGTLPLQYDFRLIIETSFHQAAVAEGEAPAGLPVKKSGTAPTQTEVRTPLSLTHTHTRVGVWYSMDLRRISTICLLYIF